MSSFEELKDHAAREQAKAYQRAQVEQAQRVLDASTSPALQRECGVGSQLGDMRGSFVGHSASVSPSVGQMLRAPGKTFTRMEVLAVVRAHKAGLEATSLSHGSATVALDSLITIFERME